MNFSQYVRKTIYLEMAGHSIHFVGDEMVEHAIVDIIYEPETENESGCEDGSLTDVDADTDDQPDDVDKSPKMQKSRKYERVYRLWCTNSQQPQVDTEFQVAREETYVENVQQPLCYFKNVSTGDMINLIADRTNLFSAKVDIARGSL